MIHQHGYFTWRVLPLWSSRQFISAIMTPFEPMKKGTLVVCWVYKGDEMSYPVLWGFCHKPGNKDPGSVNKQYFMESKAGFFFLAQLSFLVVDIPWEYLVTNPPQMAIFWNNQSFEELCNARTSLSAHVFSKVKFPHSMRCQWFIYFSPMAFWGYLEDGPQLRIRG